MKKLLVVSAFTCAGAIAPVFAQDQGDPNPPALRQEQGAPGTPAIAQESQGAPPAVTPETPPPPATITTGEPGVTSGPAVGTHVEPPTVVQKDNPAALEHASPEGVSGPSGTAAGAPGVEAKPGTQGGREWLPPEEIQRKKPSS